MNLHEFLEKFPMPGKVIFAKIWGSRSHNTHKEGSDTDFSGVFLCPTREILSLDRPSETVKFDKEDSATKENHPDHQFHEVGRFSELLLKGNPGIVEMLYTDRFCIGSEPWMELVLNRKKFLSQQAVHQYLGYMNGQHKRLLSYNGQKGLHTKGGKYNEKWAYHLLRLAEDAKRIAQGNEPIVWKEGEERDFLMKVRNEEYSWEEVRDFIEKAISSIEALKPFPLPEQGDKAFLNEWLLALRYKNW